LFLCFGVPFAIHFAYFTEYLTLVNPSMFFPHVLTDGSVGIVSGRVPVINNKGQPFLVKTDGGGEVPKNFVVKIVPVS